MVEFTDRASVDAWCRTRTLSEISVLAALSMAMKYPFTARDSKIASELRNGRVLLTALIRGTYEDREITVAAYSTTQMASEYYYDVADTAAGFPEGVAKGMWNAPYAIEEGDSGNGYLNASRLASSIESAGVAGVMALPLWNFQVPDKTRKSWIFFSRETFSKPKNLGFLD